MDRPTYRVPCDCHVCGKPFLARFNVGRRARVCTPPSHKCEAIELPSGKKLVCRERCCRSRYVKAAQAALMDATCDPRKMLSAREYVAAYAASKEIADPSGIAIRFLANTGCRLGECLAVRKEDFDWLEGRFSYVRLKTLKREGHPVRRIHLKNREAFTRELRSFWAAAPENKPLFSVPRRTLQGKMVKLFKKIKPDRVSLAHIWRHTHASRLMKAGFAVTFIQSRLGWSSLEMLKVYGHVDEEQLSEDFRKL